VSKIKPAHVVSVIALVALLILLNPSADKHREEISDSISERSQLESVLGVGKFTAFAAKYKSIGIASYTTVNGNVLTVGALGIVFFID